MNVKIVEKNLKHGLVNLGPELVVKNVVIKLENSHKILANLKKAIFHHMDLKKCQEKLNWRYQKVGLKQIKEKGNYIGNGKVANCLIGLNKQEKLWPNFAFLKNADSVNQKRGFTSIIKIKTKEIIPCLI